MDSLEDVLTDGLGLVHFEGMSLFAYLKKNTLGKVPGPFYAASMALGPYQEYSIDFSFSNFVIIT